MAEHQDISAPWWIRLFVQVGFPTALAVVLIAAMLGWMPSPIMQTLSRLEYNSWQQTMILRAICYNTEEKAARVGCEPWKTQGDK